MSLIIPANTLASGGYAVDNSLRFNRGSSDSLQRTPSGAGNRRTFTFSCWVKKTTNSAGEAMELFDSPTYSGGANRDGLRFETANHLRFFINNASSGDFATNRLFRDVSAWSHIVLAVDTTQKTASNRVKIYINGVQETSFSTETQPSQNYDLQFNTTGIHSIGFFQNDSGELFSGYMSEVVLIDGQQLDATSFGEFDEDSGIWKPINVSGLTFGTNGFYLDFEDSGALGADVSGNTNNFTVNNLTAIDQTTDTPTNNFATLNPLNAYNATTIAGISEGNLSIGGTASDGGVTSTIGVSSGKWYWEEKVITGADTAPVTGVLNTLGANSVKVSTTQSRTSGSGFWGFYNNTGSGNGIMENGTATGRFIDSLYSDNEIAMFAIDVDAQKIWYGKNGTWFSSGNPATGANASSTNLTANDTWFAYRENRSGYTTIFNFGNAPYTISSGNTDGNDRGNFEYAPPSGYLSLCTANLSEVLG